MIQVHNSFGNNGISRKYCFSFKIYVDLFEFLTGFQQAQSKNYTSRIFAVSLLSFFYGIPTSLYASKWMRRRACPHQFQWGKLPGSPSSSRRASNTRCEFPSPVPPLLPSTPAVRERGEKRENTSERTETRLLRIVLNAGMIMLWDGTIFVASGVEIFTNGRKYQDESEEQIQSASQSQSQSQEETPAWVV